MEEPTTENQTESGEEIQLAPECGNCGSRTDWESFVDESGEERWFSICGCGQMTAFLPEHPEAELKDPLAAYLLGLGRPVFPATPPWIRLFLNTIQGRRPVRWRYAWQDCPKCGASVRMGMQAYPRAAVLGICMLCLSCGYVTASYSNPMRNLVETPMTGTEWAPACPAVRRLRDCIHRSRMVLFTDGWGSPAVGTADDGRDWIPSE